MMNNLIKKIKKLDLNTIFPYILIVLGLLGLLASFVLTVDKIHYIKDPSFSPICNINPILSCKSIMSQPQSEILDGVPNTIIGVMTFPVIITVGVSMLFGAQFKKLFWQLFNAGATVGVLGVIYLFYQGTYVIGAVCLWCALTWAVVIPTKLYLLVYTWRNKLVDMPKKLTPLNDFLQKNHFALLLLIYLIVFALIIFRFDYYFLGQEIL